MVKVKSQAAIEIRRVEGYCLTYLTGKQNENWAIACIADAPIRGRELREILSRVYAGIKRSDLREQRARSIRRRLNQNGF